MDSGADTLAGGFPHSEMSGSKPARSSPDLIATCYVLHRLSVPRHPPNALVMLDPYQKPNLFGVNPRVYPTRSRAGVRFALWVDNLNPYENCLRDREYGT